MAEEEKDDLKIPVVPAGDAEGSEEEVVVTIGDEESPASEEDKNEDTGWLKELRRDHREMKKKNRKLEDQVKALTKPKEIDVLGEKPVFRDYDHDEEKFEKDLEAWHGRKRDISKRASKLEEDKAKEMSDWQAKLDGHDAKKAKLKVKNIDELEGLVMDSLSTAQQGMIVQGADDSAKVMVALGLNPKSLQEISKIKNPVKFVFAVAKLETKLKVSTKKASTPPESRIKGDAPLAGVTDSTLERLRKTAESTGDYSKVAAYKKQKRKSS